MEKWEIDLYLSNLKNWKISYNVLSKIIKFCSYEDLDSFLTKIENYNNCSIIIMNTWLQLQMKVSQQAFDNAYQIDKLHTDFLDREK